MVDVALVKRWLGRGRKLDMEIDALIEAKNRAFLSACGPGAISYEEKVQTSPGNAQEKRLLSLIDYELDIDRRIDELCKVKKEISRVIEKVSEDKLRVLLIDRYLSGMTWEDVADSMDVDVRWVYILHNKALREVGRVAERKILSASL